MPAPRAILILWLVLATPCYAGEWYATGSLGATQFTCTICQDDGTWVQEGLPHSHDNTSFAWRAGVGYQFNERWSIQAHYLNMGVVKINAVAVGDEDYNPKTHQCLANCDKAITFNTHDLYEGVELSVSRHWQVWQIEPFLRIGGAGMYHRLTAQFNNTSLSMHGWVPMALVGGGLCYHWACVETTYYKGFGGNTEWSAGLPISKQMMVTLFTVKIKEW